MAILAYIPFSTLADQDSFLPRIESVIKSTSSHWRNFTQIASLGDINTEYSCAESQHQVGINYG